MAANGTPGGRGTEPQAPPAINSYIKSKLPKGEVASFTELARALGELRTTGDKGHKQLLGIVLPRLSQYEVLPATIVAQLLQLIQGADDKKLVRHVYYLLQLLLGGGSGGTPHPVPGSMAPSLVSELPPAVVEKAWEWVKSPDVDVTRQRLELRALAATAREVNGPLDKILLEAIDATLSRATSTSPVPAGKKARRKSTGDVWDLQTSAFSAARVALKGKAGDSVARKSFWGVVSLDPLGSRHALALAASAARQNAAKLIEEEKELAVLVNSAVQGYESSGFVVGSGDQKKVSPEKARGGGQGPNLADKWARVYMARLCASLCFADWTSTDTFVQGVGAPFWKMLVMLATKDKEDLVVLEAVKALFGYLPAPDAGLDGPAPPPVGKKDKARDAAELAEAKFRLRAWTYAAAQAESAAPMYIPKLQSPESATLFGAIAVRLRKALRTSWSPPLVCSACRTVGVMAESRARATLSVRAPKPVPAEVTRVMTLLSDELLSILEGASAAAERCAALEALLWAQLVGQPGNISPSSVLRLVSAGGGASSEPWSQHLLHSLLGTILRVLRVLPGNAHMLLGYAGAIAAASPSKIKAEQLTELWSTALALGAQGKLAALHAALEFLESSTPPIAAPTTGASKEELSKAAAEEAAWLDFQRSAAWWLGEYANVAADEYAGQGLKTAKGGIPDDELPLLGLSAGEVVALKALRNPQMAAVVSHLQHAVFTLPWVTRIAATQAMAKVAMRSEEPYRLQCYAVLSSLAASDPVTDPDTVGVASIVQPAVQILDAMYSTRIMLGKLQQQYSSEGNNWPVKVLESLRARHAKLAQQIEQHVCVMPAGVYYPLGALSRDIMGSVGAEVPEAPPPGGWKSAEKGADGSPAAASPGLSELLKQIKTPTTDSKTPFAEVPAKQFDSSDEDSDAESTALPPLDLGGADDLDKLTKNLGNRIKADDWKPKISWQNSFKSFPSMRNDFANNKAFADESPDYTPRASAERSASQFSPGEASGATNMMRARGQVIHAFEGINPEELTVRADQEVQVQAEVDGWLHCVNQYGDKGLVPASYVRLLDGTIDRSVASTAETPVATPRSPEFDPFAAGDPLADFLKVKAPAATSAFSAHKPSYSFGSDYDAPAPFAAHRPRHSFSSEAETPKASVYTPSRHKPATSFGSDAEAPTTTFAAPAHQPAPSFGSEAEASTFAAPAAARVLSTAVGSETQTSTAGAGASTFATTFLTHRESSFSVEAEPPAAATFTASPAAPTTDARAAVLPAISTTHRATHSFSSEAEAAPTPNTGGPNAWALPEVPMSSQVPAGFEADFGDAFGGQTFGDASSKPAAPTPGAATRSAAMDDDEIARLEQQISQEVDAMAASGTDLQPPVIRKLPSLDASPRFEASQPAANSQTAAVEADAAAVNAAEELAREQERARAGFVTSATPAAKGTGMEAALAAAIPEGAKEGRLRTSSMEEDGFDAALADQISREIDDMAQADDFDPGAFASTHAAVPAVATPRAESVRTAGGSPAASSVGASPTTPPARQAKVIYGFDAEAEEELTVNVLDEVVVHAEVDGWYQVTRVRDGQRGLVPASYVNVL
ncbi:hypothetical protein WJX72_002624 [[Myrmecia] bisecta]|uniref:SH3 domain-containing protein n=1 Tax=[Myrmecia] bisecta TaxID=41462 RepID=A0AAW1PHC1_9CHLO